MPWHLPGDEASEEIACLYTGLLHIVLIWWREKHYHPACLPSLFSHHGVIIGTEEQLIISDRPNLFCRSGTLLSLELDGPGSALCHESLGDRFCGTVDVVSLVLSCPAEARSTFTMRRSMISSCWSARHFLSSACGSFLDSLERS